MTKIQRALAAAVLAVSLGVVSSTATAAACIASGIDTLAEWAALGATGCTEGDKLYKYVGGTLNAGVPGLNISFAGGDDPNAIHQLFIGGPAIYTSGQANMDWTLIYSIEVTDLTRFISSVDLDVTQSAQTGSTTVSKVVKNAGGATLGTLTSLNGAAIAALAVNEQFLQISETFSKTGNAIMNSAQNTYTQNQVPEVPEPGTMALLGLGMIGLVVARRRKS
jgi:hypothetical protein